HSPLTSPQPIILYAQNFYPMEEDYPDRYRWGRNNLKLLVMNPSDQEIDGTLRMEVASIIDRDLQVSVNGKPVKTLHIPSNYEKAHPTVIERVTSPIPFIGRPMYPYEEPYPVEPDTILLEGIYLRPGDNEIVLYSPQGAQVMDELVGNGDRREVCLRVWDTVRFRGQESGIRDQGAEGKIGNTEFSYNIEDKKLELSAYFDGDEKEQEYVLMERDFTNQVAEAGRQITTHQSPLTGLGSQGVNLERYPSFRLEYELDDPSIQAIIAAFGIDHSGDGVVDDYVTASSSDTASAMRLNLFERARERFSEQYYRDRRDLKLVKMFLILHKKWGLDVKQPSKEGLYTFKLGNINLVSEHSLMVPGYVKKFHSDEDLAQWKLNPENVTYSAQVTKEDGLLVSPRFDSRILGVKEEEKTGELEIQIILRDGGILTGVIESEDEETIHLTEVRELQGRDVIVQKGNISLIFGVRDRKKTFEQESVEMTTSLRGLDLKQTPYLSLTYKLQDASVQTIDFSLRIDLDEDGVADASLFPGRTEELKDWNYVGAFGKIDLYESRLSEDFPASYTTEGGGKGRFEVLKEDTRMTTTWRGWSYKEGMVQVGFEDPRRVVVSVPAGTAPTAQYMVRYLPLPRPSEMYSGYETLEINVKEVLKDAFPEHLRARPVELVLNLKRIDEADLTATTDGTDRKGSYDFYLKEASFYRKYAFPLKEQAGELLKSLKGADVPLVRVADAVYRLDVGGNDRVLTREGAWLPPMKVPLKEGVYEDGVEFLPNPTFKVDLVELANKPYEPPVETARVRFRKINPTRYQAFVKADKPFELVFSESFHRGWKAYTKPISPEKSEWAWSVADTTEDGAQILSDEGKPGWSAVLSAFGDRGKRTEIETHYVVNGYANGWHVEPGKVEGQRSEVGGQGAGLTTHHSPLTTHQREFEIVLEYKPQRLFEIGVLISVLTLVGCIGYLGVDFGRRRKKRTP
ncbi:MAG: hypothetical protein J7M27_05100, partial [Candidatus Latescibacteria bacterium]|nr:hypothetical protein [Candidatus Latescibacterota bacterium]